MEQKPFRNQWPSLPLDRALTAPLPEGWTVHLDGDGNEFFFNAATNASTYEHPMDEHYRWACGNKGLQE
jgi:hypothetical protein